ncbi:MAG TPA: glycosyl hydrolase family 28-related protein [Segetibacter sp.]|nr:glycosyl hydrolase family 28-related protein [Segetibacter sp.]
MIKIYYIFLLTITVSNSAISQVSINNNGAPPHPSAMLDVTSTNKGLLPPRMSHSDILAIKSPAEGLIVYDSTFHKPLYYNGSLWTPLNDSSIACNCTVVSAVSKGAKADFIPGTGTGTDNSDAIQNAIEEVREAGGGKVLLPSGKLKITKPIITYDDITILGCGKNLTQVYKVEATASNIQSIAAPGRTLSDNYNVNSFISIIHRPNRFTYDCKIEGIGFYGDGTTVDIGIYAPRTTRLGIRDIYIKNAKKGFVTYDSWFGSIENVLIEAADYGVSFENDGEGQGTGTSMSLTNVWAIDAKIKGYHIYGLSYSSFRNIACDGFNREGADLSGVWGAACYAFHVSHNISISGIGFEESRGAALFLDNSSVDISGGYGLNMRGYNNTVFSGFVFLSDHAFLKLTNVHIPGIVENRTNFWNVVVQNSSRIISENTSLPSGPGPDRVVQKGSEIIENSTLFNRDGVIMKVKLEAL